VERVREINFLGVKIQENLSWKLHMIDLVLKLRAGLGISVRIKSFLNRALLLLYHTLIESNSYVLLHS